MSEFIHATSSDKHEFPTQETFIRPQCLNKSYDYPLRIGDGSKKGTGFWTSPAVIDSDGNETSPWIEYSRLEYERLNSEKETYDCHSDDDSSFFTMDDMSDKYTWHLSPRKKYILSPDAKIYHFHSADDYKNALMKYPGYTYGCYSKDDRFYGDKPSASIYYHLRDQYLKYFLNPLTKLTSKLRSHGFTQDAIDSIIPKESGPYIFHAVEDGFKKNITSFECVFDYADIDNYRIKKQHKLEKAYAQLKYHSNKLLELIEKYYADLLEQVKPDCIDYDAMRADGWNGFHLHNEAIEEAKVRSDIVRKSNNKFYDEREGVYEKDIYDIMTWWSVDSMCVWDWCFV